MDSFNSALNCGAFVLPWNAIMLVLGVLVAVIVTEILVKKRRLYKDLALDCCIIALPCGIVGARLFAAASGRIGWADFFNIGHAGMNLPGALLFALIGVFVYCRVKKFRFGAVLDVLMPGAFFGLAVGRWSDFFLCEGLGPVVQNPALKFFPVATFTEAYFTDHATVAYAVFFLDFLVCLALGITALVLLKKQKRTGLVSRITIAVYLVAAFLLEWLRDAETRQLLFGGVRFNQLIWMLLLLIFVVYLLFLSGRKQTPETVDLAMPEPAEEPEKPEEAEEIA